MTILKRKEKADFFFKNDLELCRQNVSARRPVNHQQDAINKLNEWFETAEQPSGTIMVLPTGSGKTFTAIRFLCQGPISKGYKVLWLAHTHHLLEQAYFSFLPENENQGYEIGWISEPKENIGIRVVSGSPNNFKVDQIKKSDDIVIATLQTVTNAYKNKHPQLEKFLESANGKLIVVFDEAHHAPAPSYRKLLIGDDSLEIRESLRERFPEMYILGLTATPTYNDEEKRGWLKEIFPQEIVYQAQIKDLIFEKILANPNTIESETEIPLELNEREYQRLVREYEKDIPQKMIKRLAENKNRNQYIVDTYVKNKNKYGKTIIFADRREQCEYLNKLLLNEGIRSDVMYSASGRERENINALEEFKNDDLDVIVNIRMLTEGTDVPDVDSVFLTRQTTSEILLTQMVGRALRGPRFGGTEDANLVFFIDNWKQQINWAKWDPKTWGTKRAIVDDGPIPFIPWDLISVKMIQELIDNLSKGEAVNGSFFSSMPVGWYHTKFFKSNESENADGSDGNVNELILVFEDNKEGYERLINYLQEFNIEKFDDEEIKFEDCKEEINELCNKFFTPAEEQIDRDILKNIFRIALHIAQDRDNKAPKFIEFEDRDKYDLDVMAEEFIDADYGPRTVDQKLRELYEDKNQIWTTIYYNYDLFKSQFNSSIDWILKKKNGFIIDKITTEEQKLVEKLKNGTLDEKIDSCNDLMDMGTKDAIHEDTLELLIETSENDDNEKLREAAEYAVNKILSLELTPAQKRRIKKRDGYKCLCCGEDAKSILQVDHINPRYFGVDNSDENLQTLCSICNGTKGTETIDFSKKITDLGESELKFPDIEKTIDELIYEKGYHIKDSKWWEKYLKRKINFIYRCGAVKSVFIGDENNFHNWEIELHNGNNPEWIMHFIEKIKPYIQAIRKSNGLLGPDGIDIFESSDREQISYLQDAVIVPAKLALDEYLEHSVYMCQPRRSFRPVDYFGFYFDGKISRYIPKVLGKVEDVEFTLEGVENANLSKNTKRKLLFLLKSLEKSDSVGRLGYRNKVIFLSSPDSKDTIKLKNEIINDKKSKSGKTTAFTQNQRYVMVRKLMKNPRKTSEL